MHILRVDLLNAFCCGLKNDLTFISTSLVRAGFVALRCVSNRYLRKKLIVLTFPDALPASPGEFLFDVEDSTIFLVVRKAFRKGQREPEHLLANWSTLLSIPYIYIYICHVYIPYISACIYRAAINPTSAH